MAIGNQIPSLHVSYTQRQGSISRESEVGMWTPVQVLRCMAANQGQVLIKGEKGHSYPFYKAETTNSESFQLELEKKMADRLSIASAAIGHLICMLEPLTSPRMREHITSTSLCCKPPAQRPLLHNEVLCTCSCCWTAGKFLLTHCILHTVLC